MCVFLVLGIVSKYRKSGVYDDGGGNNERKGYGKIF